MWSSQIDDAVEKLEPLSLFYKGCITLDKIPININEDEFFFVNTLTSKESQLNKCGHWLLVWKEGNCINVYDSLGNLEDSFLKHFRNEKKIQIPGGPKVTFFSNHH